MPLTASQMHIADLVAEEEADRRTQYDRAWRAYDGEGPKPLEVGPDEADDNIRLDYPALIVDKGVSFLLGKEGGLTLQPVPPEDAAAPDEDPEAPDPEDLEAETPPAEEGDDVDEAERALDASWPLYQRQLDLHNLATNGGICGHLWVRLYKDGRASVLDPGNCSAEWNEDDVSILEKYLIAWNTVDPEDGLGVMRRWRIEPDNAQNPASWTIYLEEHDDDSGLWREIRDEEWPYPFAPIVEGQNLPSPNTFYGKADLSPAVLDMVEQLESVASDARKILRHHGHPIPVVTGEEASKLVAIEMAIGELLAIPNKDAKLTQLQIAELTSALEFFSEMKTALFESAKIPKVALGETTNAGPTTGVALKVEYEPLVEKTDTKHLTYGYVISEVARRLLELAGLKGWTITIGWPDSTPSDPKADAEADESELRMGIVSKQTISEKRGYTWTVEQERIAEEGKASAEGLAAAFNGGKVEDE